jgi:hypothetical protein
MRQIDHKFLRDQQRVILYPDTAEFFRPRPRNRIAASALSIVIRNICGSSSYTHSPVHEFGQIPLRADNRRRILRRKEFAYRWSREKGRRTTVVTTHE